ncbi:MAG: DUF1275 domain-containing protein [Firmicutes bacterium]|nr:DUF1275 domain-containing protein [Bacillota bacterium]
MTQPPHRSLLRIARRQTVKLLRSTVEPEEIHKTLKRTVHGTLELIPLDSQLLLQEQKRSKSLNRQLAWSLAFVAGAVNAGGFLAVGQYTSHVSGMVSKAADGFALGHPGEAVAAVSTVACFAAGAVFTSLLLSFGQRQRFRSRYALSLAIEAILLLVLGMMSAQLQHIHRFALPLTVVLLVFIMGMHNSVVTTISSAEVRTTHMTGIVTDIGIELGKLFYFNRDRSKKVREVIANLDKLRLHALILAAFFGGGITGAIGFRKVGFKLVLPLAAFLGFLALRPIIHDLRVRARLMRH